MKKFFDSPWPLIIVMSLGTATALFTSVDFIVQNDKAQSVETDPSASVRFLR